MANYSGFVLYGGEEQYFAFAKQFMNPDWIPNSASLSHPAGGNLVFQVINGFLLRYISFESLAFFGRTANFILLSIPLALILKKLRLNNIASAVLFQLFFLPHQSFFAGEWIFQNYEVKSLAYIFVFYSIYQLLKGRYILSGIFAAIATWFHFLVGGWMFFLLFVYLLIQREGMSTLLKTSLCYLLVALPFIIYLGRVYLSDNPSVIDGVNIGQLYAFKRLPHHIGITHNWPDFKKYHLDGVLVSLGFLLLCIFYFRRFKNKHIRVLNTINIILFTEQFAFLIVSLFDKNATLLKTYPFRTNSLSALLIMIELALLLKYHGLPWLLRKLSTPKNKNHWLKKRAYTAGLSLLFVVLFLIVFASEWSQTFSGKNKDSKQPSADMLTMMNYIDGNTPKDAVFLVYGELPWSFHRIANRERFVVYKFTPTMNQAIYDWHQRYQWKGRVGDLKNLDEFNSRYEVDYFVSTKALNHPALELDTAINTVRLYKNNRDITLQ